MDIKDVKIGMLIRIKDKIELDENSEGKNGIRHVSSMAAYTGLEYTVYEILTHSVVLCSCSWCWDPDWLEPVVEIAIIPDQNNINIHDIYYEE